MDIRNSFLGTSTIVQKPARATLALPSPSPKSAFDQKSWKAPMLGDCLSKTQFSAPMAPWTFKILSTIIQRLSLKLKKMYLEKMKKWLKCNESTKVRTRSKNNNSHVPIVQKGQTSGYPQRRSSRGREIECRPSPPITAEIWSKMVHSCKFVSKKYLTQKLSLNRSSSMPYCLNLKESPK